MFARAMFFLCCISAQLVFGQKNYYECDRSDIEEFVLDFGINSEKLTAFGYYAEVRIEQNNFERGEPVQQSITDAIFFEDRKSKSKRTDVMKVHGNTPRLEDQWSVVTTLKGKRYASYGPTDYLEDTVLPPSAELPISSDPCMAAISEPQLVRLRKAGDRDYWSDLLVMDKLLWCESNGRLTRGEWTLGTGEFQSYVQVYFDKDSGGMPVLTRFILPKDYDKRFQRLGRRYCCDITTTWTKRGDCYVPARVQSMIENYTTAGSFRSTLEVTTEYFWKSKLCTNKGIDPSVFTPKKIPSETLFESFDLVGK
ncbi:MAG: hypothetical protein MUC83_08585 [Pirellula sp.]|jgi:hypothetical protein|nr:hypothetical protein [Pirellula sp.]